MGDAQMTHWDTLARTIARKKKEFADFEAEEAKRANKPPATPSSPPGPPPPPTPRANSGDVAFSRRTAPAVVIYMHGEALRAGFPIPCPSLDDVNGVKPVFSPRKDRGENFKQGIMGWRGDVPIFWATWNLRYELPEVPPGEIGIPLDSLQLGL